MRLQADYNAGPRQVVNNNHRPIAVSLQLLAFGQKFTYAFRQHIGGKQLLLLVSRTAKF